jgi:HAD superfamily hydrolase (TIGR01549 family)
MSPPAGADDTASSPRVFLPRAVLFDLDGVLVRTERLWFDLLNEAAIRFHAPGPVVWEKYIPTFGQGADADIRDFGYQCDVHTLEAFFNERYEHHLKSLERADDAPGLLARLRAANIRTAVVTNSMHQIAQKVLVAADLRGWFDVVACADEAGKPKPAPDVLHLALSRLGLSPPDALMVGDSRFDQGAAQAAHVRFVGLRLDSAPWRINSLEELAGQLGV